MDIKIYLLNYLPSPDISLKPTYINYLSKIINFIKTKLYSSI